MIMSGVRDQAATGRVVATRKTSSPVIGQGATETSD